MTTDTKPIPKVRSLTCCCCGNGTQGRQWWNRDTGYGLCESCAENLPTKHGVPPEEMHDLYGVRGVHYDLGFNAHLLAAAPDLLLLAKRIAVALPGDLPGLVREARDAVAKAEGR